MKWIGAFLIFLLSVFFLDKTLNITSDYKTRADKINTGIIDNSAVGNSLKKLGYVHFDNSESYQKYLTNCKYDVNQSTKKSDEFVITFKANSLQGRQHLILRFEGQEQKWVVDELITLYGGEHEYKIEIEGQTDLSTIRLFVGEEFSVDLKNIKLYHNYLARSVQLTNSGYELSINNNQVDAVDPLEYFTLEGEKPEIAIKINPSLNFNFKNAHFNKRAFKTDCNYTVGKIQQSINKQNVNEKIHSIPTVKITAEESDIYGVNGIATNKGVKGLQSEKRASLIINNNGHQYKRKIGLRFHGGGPGRKNDRLESFRVYIRNTDLDSQALYNDKISSELKTVVFKYTLQVKPAVVDDTNAFSHALGLEVANAVGALVPRHQLVNLFVNDEYKGIYLAMDHLSDRTLSRMLDVTKDTLLNYFVYKKENSNDDVHKLYHVTSLVSKQVGEKVFDYASKYYDINNIINSMILTSYIGDDDYCQGVDIVRKEPEGDFKATIVNWDLDHGFVDRRALRRPDKFNRKAWEMTADRVFSEVIHCPRSSLFQQVYQESHRFRVKYKERLIELLDTNLNYKSLRKILDEYQVISDELDGKYDDGINVLDDFIKNRGKFVLDSLNAYNKSNGYE